MRNIPASIVTTPVALLVLFFASVIIIALGALQFVEYKEYPHLCAMTQDRTSFHRVVSSSTAAPSHYELFEVTDSSSSPGKQKQQHAAQNLVFFVHGNSGNAGEARWYFSELMKLISSSSSKDDDDAATMLSSRLFSFSFGEESSIHSGIVIERQIRFVVDSVMEQRTRTRSAQGGRVVDKNQQQPRCIWFLGHSMGGIVARRASARLQQQWRTTRNLFRSAGDEEDEEINICGVFVFASPQHRLPVHLNADVDIITQQLDTGSIIGEGDHPPITVLVSVTGGAGDVEVFEPLARLSNIDSSSSSSASIRHKMNKKRDSVIQVQVSSVSLAAISTSHHGITYCHQVVRPVMRSLLHLMSTPSVRASSSSSSGGGGGGILLHSSAAEAERVQGDMEAMLLSPVQLQARVSSGADVNPREAGREQSTTTTTTTTMKRMLPVEFEAALRGLFSPRTMLVLTAAMPSRSEKDKKKKVVAVNESQEEQQHQQQQQQFSNVALPVPWVTSRHDVFTVRDGCDSSSKSTHLRFISSAYNFHSSVDENRIIAGLLKRESSSSSSSLLFPCSSSSSINVDDLHLRSTVIPDSRSRVFWSAKHVSLGASAFWISARFKQNREKSAAAAASLFPVIVASCGSRSGYLLNLRDEKEEQHRDDEKWWMWMPAFTGGTLLFSTSYVLPPTAGKCELMLLSAEPLCGGGDDGSDSPAPSSSSSSCWEMGVSTAPLPFRMVHAARYCDSSYELAFAAAGMFLSLLIVLGAVVVGFFYGGGGKLGVAIQRDVSEAFVQNPLFFVHSGVVSRSETALLTAVTLVASLAVTFMWVLLAVSRAAHHGCDSEAKALASVLTLALAVALSVAAILAVAALRLAVDRVPVAAAMSRISNTSLLAKRMAPVFVCVFLCFTVAPLAPFFSVACAVWFSRSVLGIRATTATPRTAKAFVLVRLEKQSHEKDDDDDDDDEFFSAAPDETPQEITAGTKRRNHHHHHHRQHRKQRDQHHQHEKEQHTPIFPPGSSSSLPTMTQLQQQQFLCTEALHLWWWTISLASSSLLTTVFTVRNMAITKSILSQVLTHDVSSTALAGFNCLPLFALMRVKYPMLPTDDWNAWRLVPFGVYILLLFSVQIFFLSPAAAGLDLRDVPTVRYVIVASVLLGGAVRALAMRLLY